MMQDMYIYKNFRSQKSRDAFVVQYEREHPNEYLEVIRSIPHDYQELQHVWGEFGPGRYYTVNVHYLECAFRIHKREVDPTPYCHVCGAMTRAACIMNGCPDLFYAENH